MNNGPKVSIGMPVYNGEKTLSRAIESILGQDYSNIEFIISDNCSTDSTPIICAQYARMDSRIRYERLSENHGSIANFNHVFELSNGEYFMWASHDDLHEPTYVSQCLKRLSEDAQAALCAPRMRGVISPEAKNTWIGDLSSFSNKKSVVGRYLETLRHFPAVAVYGLYRSSMIRKTSLLPKVIGSDLLFIQNLSLYGTFIGIDQILFTYFGREEWNTVDQDYAVFYGKSKKPWYFSPFVMVFLSQINMLRKSKHSLITKFGLLGVLLRFQMGQLILKIALKMIKFGVPSRFKMMLATPIYWRYIHSPNVKVEGDDQYTERIIRPIVGLRND